MRDGSDLIFFCQTLVSNYIFERPRVYQMSQYQKEKLKEYSSVLSTPCLTTASVEYVIIMNQTFNKFPWCEEIKSENIFTLKSIDGSLRAADEFCFQI